MAEVDGAPTFGAELKVSTPFSSLSQRLIPLQDGFKPASAWVSHGIAWLDEVQQFYRDRSAIEREYSAKLAALAKRYFDKKNKRSAQLSVGESPTMTPGSLERSASASPERDVRSLTPAAAPPSPPGPHSSPRSSHAPPSTIASLPASSSTLPTLLSRPPPASTSSASGTSNTPTSSPSSATLRTPNCARSKQSTTPHVKTSRPSAKSPSPTPTRQRPRAPIASRRST